MRHFLLIYDVKFGRLGDEPKEFKHADAAVTAYMAAEEQYRVDGTKQVMLIASDSLDTIKVTHRNFFERETIDDLIRSVMPTSGSEHLGVC